MVDHTAYQKALRARAATLVVCTTGAITLAAAAPVQAGAGSTFARTIGSFVDDGFVPGMELTAVGFDGDNDGVATVIAVSALVCTVDRTLTADPATAGRTLYVTLPSDAEWLNERHEPTIGRPYWEERYIPGPAARVTGGAGGQTEVLPMYQVLVHVPENTGFEAGSRYADALIAHFAQPTAIIVNGEYLRIRDDAGPFPGTLTNSKPGFAVVPVTIAFRLRTTNPT